MDKRLLILGGTSEAAALARAAVEAFPGADVISSLAGRLVPAPELPGRVRVGGFGGARGLAEYLDRENIGALVDATHPFAAAISAHARTACDASALPRIMLARPPWRPEPADNWVEAADYGQAAARLPGLGRRAFLTTGTAGMDAFAAVEGVHFLVRLIRQPAAPLPLADATLITGRPPNAVADERALMETHAIEVLVTKQSGGTATRAKLEAARGLGLPVLMIARPPAEDGTAVETVEAALAWLRELEK